MDWPHSWRWYLNALLGYVAVSTVLLGLGCVSPGLGCLVAFVGSIVIAALQGCFGPAARWLLARDAALKAIEEGLFCVAEERAREALAHARKALYQCHIMVAGASFLLCAALRWQEKDAESEAVARDACAALEKKETESADARARLAGVLAQLGHALVGQGRTNEAEPVAARCQECAEASAQSSLRAMSTALWSDLRLRQGQCREAGEWMRRSIGEYENSRDARLLSELPELHANLGNIYLCARQAVRAIGEYRAALDGFEKKGAGGYEFSVALMNLGVGLLDADRNAEAEERIREALRLRERHVAPDDERLSQVWVNLAIALAKQGKAEEAEAALGEAARWKGRLTPDVEAAAAHAEGRLRAAQQRWEEAEAALREGLRQQTEQYGSSHPEVIGDLLALAEVVEARGRTEEAGALRAEIARIQEGIGDV